MIVSLPVEIDTIDINNIIETATPFYLWEQTVWYKDDLVLYDGKVYIALDNIIVQTYDPLHTYEIGDVVWGEGTDDSSPNEVMFATEGEVPKPPSLYDTVDTDPDHTTWGERFFRITPDGVSVYPTYPYEFIETKADGYTHTYYFNKTSPTTMYVRLIVKDASQVIKEYTDATLPIHTVIVEDKTVVTQASTQPVTGSTYDSWFPAFIFEDAGGVFIRTTVSDAIAPREFIFVTDAQLFKAITKPDDIPDFVYYSESEQSKPFDTSNYTKSIFTTSVGSPYMNLKVTTSEECNMFVLGYVKGTHFDYYFRNASDVIVFSDTNVPIDGSRDTNGILSDWYTTKVIYYNSGSIPAGGSVEVRIYNNSGGSYYDVELGTFMIGAYVDAGMTNLTLQNKYRDFSVFEYDPWGNPSYTERAKVSVYTGTVDINITDYDRIDRLMTSLGKNIVIIDGSDNYNNYEVESTTNVFAATQKIGRFMSFDQKTIVRNGDIDTKATYSFTLEEIV